MTDSSQIPNKFDLEHRDEFKAALQDYRMGDAANKILQETPFVSMTAPTATGRNTIINELIKTGNYHFVVSDTTRPPRYNDGILEQNGVEYFFRTEEEMLDEIKRGEFIEAEVIHDQQVSGQSIREIEKAKQEGKIAVSDIDILGACNMAELKPDAVTILLLPPTFEEWLRRIHKRTKVTDVELHRRLQTATRMLKTALSKDFFIFVVNDDFDQAVKTVDEIARTQVHHPESEAAARALAGKLYEQTCDYLRTNAPDFKPF